MLGNSSVNPRRNKRASSSYHRHHSSKLSVKDLALELAKKHVSITKKGLSAEALRIEYKIDKLARKAFSFREDLLLPGGQEIENNQL